MIYKFIQISDIGFNHSLSTDIEINKYVEKSRRETYQKLIDLCIEKKVTALLICGNLYDENHISYENARLIKKGFARLNAKDIAVVYAHGKLDKGQFLDSIQNEVTEIKSKYTRHINSQPFDLNTVNYFGIGYSKRLVFQDEFLEEEASENPAIGLMYLDTEFYENKTLDLINRRMEKSNIHYWAVGGSKHFADKKLKSNYCYSGHFCPKRNEGPSCVLVTISNKMKVTTEPIDICSDIYTNIHVDDPYSSKDIYELLERCADLIVKSKVPGHNMIVNLEISGYCTCYDQLITHRKALQDEMAKITETKLCLNINNLTKGIEKKDKLGDGTQVTELIKECSKLYDDEELLKNTVNSLKSKRVFYNKDAAVDKRKLLEGVDSIILESSIKEDSNDY